MPTLTMFVGLPASGKTQRAKEILNRRKHTVRISNDDLRKMLHDGVWSRENERLIDIVRDNLIQLLMSKKMDILVDNCNLHPKHKTNYLNLCSKYGYDFAIEDFRHVPLNECIKRDSVRPNYVTERVIRKMYLQFIHQEPAPRTNLYNLPSCIIVDVDGTMALSGDRDPYDESRVYEDAVNWPVVNLLKSYMAKFPDTKVFIFSGRTIACSETTIDWFHSKAAIDFPYSFHQREVGDKRHDWILKEELYNRFVAAEYFVDFVMDDRAQVVELVWRRLGLPCLQVNESEF